MDATMTLRFALRRRVSGDRATRSVTGVKVRNATLTGAKIVDGSLTEADTADGAVDPTKLGTIPGARVRHAASAVTVQHNATAALSFDTTDFNVGGVYGAAQPSRMTAPIAGRCFIVASARWNPNSAGRRTIALEVNGTAAQIARPDVSAYMTTGSLGPEPAAQTVYRLNAGDYVEVWACQDSGGRQPPSMRATLRGSYLGPGLDRVSGGYPKGRRACGAPCSGARSTAPPSPTRASTTRAA